MKVFHCDECGHMVFFENTLCLRCGNRLAYIPEREEMTTLVADAQGQWQVPAPLSNGMGYKLCQNYAIEGICNWALPAQDSSPYCVSCRLTKVIPDLSLPGNRTAWAKLEMAKRRAIYTLLCLRLPVLSKDEVGDNGLSFEFLGDPVIDPNSPHPAEPAKPVLTGHEDGVITLNIAEADDVERERRRSQMGEPYRTLLGHFRHELAHYYWERLVANTELLEPFRETFGDERADYGDALERYYQQGPSANWSNDFISAYATSHPWEDWAETWAHYMHVIDTIEMAVECGLSLKPWRKNEPEVRPSLPVIDGRPISFDRMMDNWFGISYVLNNLNRCLGLPDGYPFVISDAVITKLLFVHNVLGSATHPDFRASLATAH